MKKATSLLGCTLLLLTGLYPAGSLITACFGYRFRLISIPAFSAVLALPAICAVLTDLADKRAHRNGAAGAFWIITAPLSLVNGLLFLFACPQIGVLACTLIVFGCCCYLTVRHGRPPILKGITLVLSALMILPFCFLSFFALVFGNFGQDTVVETVDSPSGKYCAQVIDSDQGALGGNTLVEVQQNGGFDAILFQIEKKPQLVYFGNWGEFETMQIYWKDDKCLVINAVTYEIE